MNRLTMLSSRLLKQFVAVAEQLHFGRAAHQLHMAQPPLSQAIKHLEELIGVQLLSRTKHSVTLTPAGLSFLEDAREWLAHERRAIDMARRAGKGVTGRATIGFVGSVSYALLPKLLREFRARYPEIHIDLRELTSTEQVDGLRNGRIDVGIVRLPLSDAADIALHVIETERFIAVLPRDHPLADKDGIHLRELEQENFMVFPPDKIPSLHAKFLFACEQAGFSPRIALQAWQMASMVSLVAAGMGVALLPAQVRNSPHQGVVYKDLLDVSEHLELKIAVAWRSEKQSAGVLAMQAVLGHAGVAPRNASTR
jgi:DNA-binding transcriptional LysR family regulator